MKGSTIEAIPTDPQQTMEPSVEGWLVRFADNAAGAGNGVIRTFTRPREAIARREHIAAAELPAFARTLVSDDHVAIIVAAPGHLAPLDHLLVPWLSTPEHPDSMPTIVFKSDGYRITWRPCRALIEALPELQKGLFAAIVDFTFYEGELRQMERELPSYECHAHDDASRAYEIRRKDRSHWNRLRQTMEKLSRMRLRFAQLKPQLTKGAPALPVYARRASTRLMARADAAARLEAVSDRLEACENLYEGAVDRIIDYGWWRSGHLLEVWIVLLLVLEAALMACELIYRR